MQTPLALSTTDVASFSYEAGSANGSPATTGILDTIIPVITGTFGGLIADCVPTGTPSFQSTSGADSRLVLDSGDVLFAATTSNRSTVRARLVATGFEVENTTAPLYRQGACTVYNSPSHEALRVVRPSSDIGTAIRGQVTLQSFSAPPRTESRAKAFLGSRTWHAEHGAYVPSRFNSLHNPPQEFAGMVWMATDQDGTNNASPTFAPNALTIPLIPGTTLANVCGNQYANVLLPIDNAGAYFTGLSEQTVLTLMVRQTWEIFPAADISLMRLAQPSPLYDPRALEVYSQVLREMPLGTIRADNDAGKWFRTVLQAAKKAMPYVAAAGGAMLNMSPLGLPIKIAGTQLLNAASDASKQQKKSTASKPSIQSMQKVGKRRR